MTQSNAVRNHRSRTRKRLLAQFPGATIPDDVVVLRLESHYGLYSADDGSFLGKLTLH